MKTFRVIIHSIEGEGDITVEVKASDGFKACESVIDTLCWDYEEVEDDGDDTV